METVRLCYSENKQKKLAYLFLGMAIIGAACAVYMWFYANPVLLSVLVGGVVLSVLGLAMFIRLEFTPKRDGEIAIQFSPDGITAQTTPVAKAAGLIEWQDIVDIRIYERELAVLVRDPRKYAGRMKNFFVKDTFLKANKGQIRISIIEVDTTAADIGRVVDDYLQ